MANIPKAIIKKICASKWKERPYKLWLSVQRMQVHFDIQYLCFRHCENILGIIAIYAAFSKIQHPVVRCKYRKPFKSCITDKEKIQLVYTGDQTKIMQSLCSWILQASWRKLVKLNTRIVVKFFVTSETTLVVS